MNKIFTNELNNFLKYLNNNGYSKSTINNYSFGLKKFFDYLNKKEIGSVNFKNQDIINFKKTLIDKNSGQTINSKIFAIKRYVEYLKETKNINLNWNIDIIKIKNKKNIIPIKNINKLLNYINEDNKNNIIQERDKLLIKMLYYTGFRTKELLEVVPKNISDNILKLHNKNIILNADLADCIKDYINKLKIKNEQYIFFSYGSKKLNFNSHLTEKSVQDIFNKYKSIIDINLSIIDLRNSYAINLKERLINTKFNKIYSHKIIKFNGDYLQLRNIK